MIEFPETALTEWFQVARVAEAEHETRKRIEQDILIEAALEKKRVDHMAKQLLEQELAADETPKLEMFTLAEMQANPQAVPTDLIEGVMGDNSVCLMLGPSGSGKTTLALQMIHSVQSGDKWLGAAAVQMSGGIGIMSYDMDATRMKDWMDGFPGIDPTMISLVNAYKQGNPLAVPDFRKKIASVWKDMGTEVVVIDSFSASFFGHDQNDAASVMAHYRDLKRFALGEVGARALIVIVHSTEASPDKVRGSTVHHDVADSIVSVTVEKSGNRRVKMVKYRAAIGHTQMAPVIIGAPDDVTHLVQVDVNGQRLADLPLPPGSEADVMFGETMDLAHEAPDTKSDETEEEID